VGSLSRGAATPLLFILLLGATGAGSAAHAQLKVRYPIVDYREVEIEPFGDVTFDKPKSGLSNSQRFRSNRRGAPSDLIQALTIPCRADVRRLAHAEASEASHSVRHNFASMAF